jgi:hypothetical protein
VGYPRHQKVLCITRGRRTRFFYGPKLGELVTTHVKIGDDFGYATLTTSKWRVGKRTGETTYGTEA